jgi:hypothetical protein
VANVGLGLTGMTWNGGSWLWPDWKRHKIDEVGFGLSCISPLVHVPLMSILCLLRCCPVGPTLVTVLSMENMATALLHAGQMALHIDRIEWGRRTRQSQGSYRCPQDGGVVHGPRHSFHSSFNTILVYDWVRGVGSIS